MRFRLLCGTSVLFTVFLLWLVRDRWWFRVDDVNVFVDGRKMGSLRTYQSSNGRILVIADGHALLSDRARSLLGIPQGGVWLSTRLACFGPGADVLLVPAGKSEIMWKVVELRGPVLKDGRIAAKLPTLVLEGEIWSCQVGCGSLSLEASKHSM